MLPGCTAAGSTMNERTSRKIPVTERQFLWVQDDDKGEVTLHVGPTMVSPTAADRVVIDDGAGRVPRGSVGRPQMMVEVGDNQYAVLYNPLVENDGGPNGKFKQGRNEPRPLKNGTRSMIPGPCSFWLRPGQRVEVRDAHELASDQYLVVKVYGRGRQDRAVLRGDRQERRDHARDGGERPRRQATGATTRIDQLPPLELRRGQLIVIRGLDTQLYIPPTGVDIVPDTSVDDTGAGDDRGGCAPAAVAAAQARRGAARPRRSGSPRTSGRGPSTTRSMKKRCRSKRRGATSRSRRGRWSINRARTRGRTGTGGAAAGSG